MKMDPDLESHRAMFASFPASVSAIAALTLSWQATAQTSPGAPRTSAAIPAPQVAEAADRLLKQMGAYIGSAEQFTFRAAITFDHVLPSGQKVQFAANENVALQRPDRLYVEWTGDLGNRQFWYDGKKVTIYDFDTIFYGTDTAPPAIDGTLDKLVNQLNFTPPLVDFLYSDPYKSLRGGNSVRLFYRRSADKWPQLPGLCFCGESTSTGRSGSIPGRSLSRASS